MKFSSMQHKQFFTLIIISLIALVWPTLLLAQTGSDVVVDGIETVETGDHVLLRIFFTLEGDELGGETAVSQAPVPQATIQLEDGTTYPAALEKPPYFISLVIDGSKSMEPVLAQVKQAAIDFVNAAPPEAQFSVISFDNHIELLQPYTSDHTQVIAAINRIQTIDTNTCFYDVAYTATQSLEQLEPSANRALLLFTDGQGEAKPGSNNPTCRNYTTEGLLASTANRQETLPVYIIGIAETQKNVDEAVLSQLADAIDGSFIDGTATSFNTQLQAMGHEIGSHWVAEAVVTPAQGTQRGGLLLTLADGTLPPPGPFVFNSNADYRQAEDPDPAIHISNFRYNKVTDSFSFDTSLTNLDSAAQMLAETLDAESNVQVDMTLIQNPAVLQQVRLNTTSMVAAGRYVVDVVVRDASGKLLTHEDGSPVSDSYEFTYNPPQPFKLTIDSVAIQDEPARFNFETLKLEDDEVRLLVEYHTSGENLMAQLNGRLLNQATNQRTELFTLEQLEPGLAQTAVQSDNGSYTLVVNALDEAGNVLTTDSHSFTATSPDNSVIRSGKAVRSNPLLLLLFAIICFAIGFLAWRFGHTLGYRTAYRHLPAGLNLSAKSAADEEEDAVEPLRATLTLADSPDKSLVDTTLWEIDHFPFIFGREECDITIKGDRHVSRKHAQITFENNDFFIEDLGSSNGTFVNDTQIAAREPMPLRTDKATRLQIGKTTRFLFKVQTDGEREAAEPGAAL